MKVRFAPVMLAVMLLTACRATGASPTLRPSEVASVLPTTPSASPSAAPAASVPAGFEPIDDGTLPPGDYVTLAFAIPMSLSVPSHFASDDWSAFDTKLEARLSLIRDYGAGIIFLAPSEVYAPADESPQPVPGDLAAWLMQHPGVEVTGSAEVEVGGMIGSALDIATAGEPTNTGFCGAGIAGYPLAGDPALGVPFGICVQYPRHVIVLEVDGRPLLIGIDSWHVGLLADAEEILATIAFRDPG